MHQMAQRVIGDSCANHILQVGEDLLERHYQSGDFHFFAGLAYMHNIPDPSVYLELQVQAKQSVSLLPREVGCISLLVDCAIVSTEQALTSPTLSACQEDNMEQANSVIDGYSNDCKPIPAPGNNSHKDDSICYAYCIIPDGAKATICQMAKQLETKYWLSLLWCNSVPDLLRLNKGSALQSFQLTWSLAAAHEHQRRDGCNQQRLYREGELPFSMPGVHNPKLSGLLDFIADHNTILTFYVVLCQAYLKNWLQRSHGTGLQMTVPGSRKAHTLTWSYAHTIHGWPMSHGLRNYHNCLSTAMHWLRTSPLSQCGSTCGTKQNNG